MYTTCRNIPTIPNKEATVEQAAQYYIAALRNAPNVHGQHCHPVSGEPSSQIMHRMWKTFGREESMAAIDKEIKP